MKKKSIFACMIAVLILIASFPISVSGTDALDNTIYYLTDNITEFAEQDKSSQNNDELADGLDNEQFLKYQNDGTLQERSEFMEDIAKTNKPYYATFSLNTDNQIDVSDIANIIPYANEANMPTKGNANVLVFLVEFENEKHAATETREAIEERFFGDGHSLNKFYKESSYGQLDITGDVIDWYTAEHDRSYYIENGIASLYTEVLDAYDSKIDYSQYDADGNGYIDGLYLHFAGEDSGWGSTFWSYVTYLFDKTYDGISIGRRACLLHDTATETICHETGHLLGLPDYYSYTITTLLGNFNWVGDDDAMISGNGDHNAVSKMLLGWIKQVRLISDAGDYTLGDFTDSGDAAILYPFGESEGDSFFVLQKQNDDSGTPILKVLRVNAKVNSITNTYVHSNMYGDIPFIQLIGDLKNGEAATPYSEEFSTYYYNDDAGVNAFSGVTVETDEKAGGFNVLFEMFPSVIEPPTITTTVSVNQITATVDFSVPFFIDSSKEPYLIDADGTRIATMSTKAIFNNGEGYYIDKASCVLKVASYREWGFDGQNEITVGSDQDFLLNPGANYTIVIPEGAFKTVTGEIEEIRIDITADTSADQNEKYQKITSFDRSSEFITLDDGRAAYAYVDENDSSRPLYLVLLSEDATYERYTLETGMLGHVGICQLTDGTIAVSATNGADTTTLVYKFDIAEKAVTKSLDVGKQMSWAVLSATSDGMYLYRDDGDNDSALIMIDNDLTKTKHITWQSDTLNRFVIGDEILYMGPEKDTIKNSSKTVNTNNYTFTLCGADGEVIAQQLIRGFDYSKADFIGADKNSDNNILVAYFDYELEKFCLLMFDSELNFIEMRMLQYSSQPTAQNAGTGESYFKCLADGYFISNEYVRQYNPYGVVEFFTTEKYQQGLIFDGNFNLKSSFDVAYTASAAQIGQSGDRFIIGDEYGYYTINADLTSEVLPIEIYSDVYTIDNKEQTITGVPEGTTAENLLKFITSNSERCRYELRYTHAEREEPISLSQVLSCNYELLVYDFSGARAAVYTLPELAADHDSTFKINSLGYLYNYTATDEVLQVPDFVKYISTSSSYGNDFTAVKELTTSAATISGTGFYKLEKLTLLEGCTSLLDSAFSYSHKLTSIVIPDTVTKIGNSAFAYCMALKEIVIPASVTRIGGYAFEGLSAEGLTVTYLGTRDQWDAIDFRMYDFDDDGSRYGFYDWESEFGESMTFAGSGVYQKVPEFRIEKAELSADGNCIQFKVDSDLFERLGYIKPYLQVIYNSEMRFIDKYVEDGEYYIFTYTDFSVIPSKDDLYVSLYASNRGINCVDGMVYSINELESESKKVLSSILLFALPQKLVYIENTETFNPNGGKLKLIYDNGTKEIIDLTAEMVTGFDNTKVGKQMLTVVYGDKTAQFEISIKPTAPNPPILVSKTATSVILAAVSGYEYSLDGLHWQDSPIFTDLNSSTEYSFYQRIKETDIHSASDLSPALKVTTSELIIGDINGDGSIDVRDLIRLKKMAAAGDYTQNADLIKDNKIDALDLAKMRRYLFETM